MSDFDENIHLTSPERQFDLLVDGELSEADRRALLLQLEHTPDGWRRCALAFLEAQSWKAELAQIVPAAALESARPGPAPQAEPVVPQAEPGFPQAVRGGRWQSWRQAVATTLAIAASFLLTLVVVRGWSGGSLHSPEGSVVTKAIAPFQPGKTADTWETVTLAADGQPETFRVPALHRDTLDESLLENVPDVVSPDLQRAFEQSGHRVVQQREIVPIQMKDGRRLVVPVDHVQIHYVGRPSL